MSTEVRDATLASVLAYYENYVYKHTVLDSGEPFNLNVNIPAELSAIEANSYESDYDFHADVQRVFNLLKDPHTQYVPPLCYTLFQVQLPFIATSGISNGTQTLYVKASNDEDLTESYGEVYPELSTLPFSYDGWEIVEIDGGDAMDVFMEYVQTTTSYSRDLSTRFNYALSEFFDYSTMFHSFPAVEAVEFTLRNPLDSADVVSVQAKYLISSLLSVPELSKGRGYYRLCGYEITSGRRIVERLPRDKMRRDVDELWTTVFPISDSNTIELVKVLKRQKRVTRAEKRNKRRGSEGEDLLASEGYENVLTTDQLTAYVKHKVGVMVLPTFYMTDVGTYLANVRQTLNIFAQNNVQRLVLDVRRNGGGFLCLPYILAGMISAYQPKAHNSVGDIVLSDFWKTYFCRDDMVRFEFLNMNRQPIRSRAWLKERERGDGQFYSQVFTNDCNIFRNSLALGQGAGKSTWFYEPENIVILTDGTCGSACGIFVAYFRLLDLAKVVVQGGIPELPISTSSFKGASVYDSLLINNRNEVCQRFCKCKPIPEFPTTCMMRFSWFELYSFNTLSANNLKYTSSSNQQQQQLLGFQRMSHDLRLLDWDFSAAHSGVVYDAASEAFAKCFPWEVKRNPGCTIQIERGLYGNPCDVNQSTFDSAVCTLRGCQQGYYLHGGQCIQMQNEYPMFVEYMDYLAMKFLRETILPSLFAVLGVVCVLCFACGSAIVGTVVYRKRRARRNDHNMHNAARNPYT